MISGARRFLPSARLFTLLTACCIFPLIFVGAGVTTKGAGMAFPDWPTSDGAILIPKGWLSDPMKLWEHSHRLIGWTVGMLAIGSVVISWRACFHLCSFLHKFTFGRWILRKIQVQALSFDQEQNGNRMVRTLTLVTLGLIIIQGVLGGVRVRQDSRLLAMVHGISGQITFCMAAVTALVCSPHLSAAGPVEVARARFFQNGCAVSFVAVFMQLTLGALYRHFAFTNALIAHVLWAMVVFMMMSWLTMWTLEQYPRLQPLAFLGKSLAVLIAAQMVLGGAAFLIKVMGGNWPGWLATLAPTAHVAVGALMLACTALLAVSGYVRLVPAAQQPAGAVTI